ncbi:hypothetical protein BDV96DRAFT_361463 [Lophiotrema nucula]|uniref:Uncharacterized protein n=1 Tax=Lophiotrema nucula TaxID=690887 RepID=A0A6A5ZGU2_9PLEO|nr:hypothetical protein BDV96DRAFT_361463 [Lophiotrema nucula]
MKYLSDHGSNVKVIAISPIGGTDSHDPGDEDLNGQKFPNYFYVKGSQSDIMGRTNVIAVPARDCLSDFPDLNVLYY